MKPALNSQGLHHSTNLHPNNQHAHWHNRILNYQHFCPSLNCVHALNYQHACSFDFPAGTTNRKNPISGKQKEIHLKCNVCSVTKVGPCLWWVSSPQWGQMSYLFTRWWPFKTIIVKVTILYQLCKILLWICEIHRYLRKENRWWGQVDCQLLMWYLCDTPERFERDLMIARDSKPWVQLSLRSNHVKLKLVDWSFIHHLVHQERLIMPDWHDMQCTSKNMFLIIPR